MSGLEPLNNYDGIMVTKYRQVIAVVRIGVPETRNRHQSSGNLWQGIDAAFQFFSTDPNTRVVILTGNGRDFCLEIIEPAVVNNGNMETLRSRRHRENESLYQNAIRAIKECSKPVIAAIEDRCNSLGIGLITACDIRAALKKSTFLLKKDDIGSAVNTNSLVRLHKIGSIDSWVRDVALTGRQFNGTEAYGFNLVSKLYDDYYYMVDDVKKMAKRIAEKSLDEITETKKKLNYARDPSTQDSLNSADNGSISEFSERS